MPECTATFFGFNVRDQDNKKLYRNLGVLSDRIILKIESLFETECLDCNTKYTNKLTDTPLLTCYLCLQGSHDCDSIENKAAALTKLGEAASNVGVTWLCSGCSKKNDLSLAPKKQVQPNLSSIQEESETNDVTEAKENEDEVTGESEEDRISPRRNRPNDHKNAHTGSICDAYKRRQCPHGPTGKFLIDGNPCPNAHPPRCFRFCNHGKHPRQGCNKGKECQFWHPILCKFSIKNKSCSKEECTFYHLKGTRRPHKPKQPLIQQKTKMMPKPANGNNNPATETRKMMKFDSTASLTSIYPPTVNRLRHDSLKTESNFLLRHMENIKDGIINQVAEKIADLQANLPSLIQEQINNHSANVSRPPAPPPACQPQHFQGQVPFVPQIFSQNPMYAQFQRSSY